MLKYDNIQLRDIKTSDTQLMLKWRNSQDVRMNLFSQEELTKQQHLWWLENKVATGECVQYIIELVEPYLPIGTVFIKNIDIDNNKGVWNFYRRRFRTWQGVWNDSYATYFKTLF
jgi:RimJ/RimL family protein N-acetyltransferase